MPPAVEGPASMSIVLVSSGLITYIILHDPCPTSNVWIFNSCANRTPANRRSIVINSFLISIRIINSTTTRLPLSKSRFQLLDPLILLNDVESELFYLS